MDRACRANWGKEDDWLGGIITKDNQPHPVYHAYRWYGQTRGAIRVRSTGDSKTLACRASKSAGSREVLLGSISKTPLRVTLELKHVALPGFATAVWMLPNADLDGTMTAEQIPTVRDFAAEPTPDGLRIVLPEVEENQAYRLVLNAK